MDLFGQTVLHIDMFLQCVYRQDSFPSIYKTYVSQSAELSLVIDIINNADTFA